MSYTTEGFTKLDTVVLKAIADLRLTTLHTYIWFLHYGIDGLRKIKYNFYPEYKTLRTTLEDNKMIKYPMDMVGWVSIGVQAGDRLVKIIPDSSIVRKDEDDKAYSSTRRAPDDPDDLHVYEKALGENEVGYFTDNKRERRFEFDVRVKKQEIILNYVGAVQSPGTETEVPTIAVDFLVAWIHFRNSRFLLGASNRETRFVKEELNEEARELRKNLSNLSYEGIVQAIQQSRSIAPNF